MSCIPYKERPAPKMSFLRFNPSSMPLPLHAAVLVGLVSAMVFHRSDRPNFELQKCSSLAADDIRLIADNSLFTR